MARIERLYKNDRRGVLTFEIEQDDGAVVVREGVRPLGLSEVSREVHPDAATAFAAVDALVAARTSEGWQLAIHPDPHAARYFAEGFAAQLARDFGVKLLDPDDGVLRDTEALYGRAMPPELARLLRLRGSAQLGWCNFGEWRIWPDDLVPLDLDEGSNTFEELLVRFHSHALRLFLTDLVPLGTAGNGDGYHAFVDLLRPDDAVVMMYDHEEGGLDPFADAVSSLAELNRLYVANGDGDGDGERDVLDELRRGMTRLERRVAPSWHYRQVVENSTVSPSLELPTAAKFLWFRSMWIAKLMEGDVRDAGGWFKPLIEFHRKQMDFHDAKHYATFGLPSRGLYWLFWLYFFDKPELDEAIGILRQAPSRLVRDAAAVFAELAAGRTHVGKLDFAETRRRFAALGLDPAEQERREAERLAAAERARAARRASREVTAAWRAGKTGAELAAELWARIDDRAALNELVVGLAEVDAGCARAVERGRQVVARARDQWEAALAALAAAARPEERAVLAWVYAKADPWVMGAVVGALSADERRLVVANGPVRLARLRTLLRAKFGKEHVIRALDGLGVLTDDELAAMVDRFWWSRRDEDEDEAEGEAEEAPEEVALEPVVHSTFGEISLGWAVEAEDEDEAEDESDEAEDESDEAEDEDESDEEDEESDEDESDEEDEDEEDEDEDEDESDGDEEEDAETASGDEVEPTPELDPDDPTAEHDIELDEENPLVPEPNYLKSITCKGPLRASFEALARRGSPASVVRLRKILDRGPDELRIPAMIALGQVPGDEARVLLEAALAGPLRRAAAYALAVRGDPSSLPALEALVAGLGGLPHLLVFERTMTDAVRLAAGRPVDPEGVRLALRTVMDNKYADAELHRVAVGVAAGCLPADQAEAEISPFVDAEDATVRRAALDALASIGRPVAPIALDPATIRAAYADRGLEPLREWLADPRVVSRHLVVAFVKEEGLVDALWTELAAYVDRWVAQVPFYTNNYERDGYESLYAAIRALFTVADPAVEDVLRRYLSSPSPMVRKAFEYQRDVAARLGIVGPGVHPSVLDAVAGRDLSEGVDALELGQSPFALGAPVHGVAFLPGDRVVVAGGGAVALFDRAGRRLPASDRLQAGWAYDVDHHAACDRLVVVYSHGHCFVHVGSTLERLADLSHGGMTGVRKVKFSPDGRWFATASDDRTLRVWASDTLACARVHTEPFDVNTVAWLDDDTLVFGTDQHLGVIPREGGEPRRLGAGGIAEVQVVDGRILAGTQKFGLAFVDPATLEVVERLPVTNVARARVAADRDRVFVACWDGEYNGFSRWSRAAGRGEKLHREALFALEVDPLDGRVLFGGNSSRVTVAGPDGALVLEGAVHAAHAGVGWMVLPRGSDAVVQIVRAGDAFDVLDASGQVVRYDPATATAHARSQPVRGLPRAAEAFVELGDDRVIAAFGHVLRPGFWVRGTARCEKLLGLGGAAIVASGKTLGWLDPATGALLAEVSAGVTSSWVNELFAVDDDRFVVYGYDEPGISLWSASERRRLSRVETDHRADDGRFQRPYAMSVHRGSRRLVVSHWDNQVDVWSLAGDRFTRERTLVLSSPYGHAHLSDDAQTLFVAHEQELVALAYPTAAPRWRWRCARGIEAMAPLGDGRVAVGTKDGAVFVVGVTG